MADGAKLSPKPMPTSRLLITEVLCHSSVSYFTASAQATILYNEIRYYTFKVIHNQL